MLTIASPIFGVTALSPGSYAGGASITDAQAIFYGSTNNAATTGIVSFSGGRQRLQYRGHRDRPGHFHGAEYFSGNTAITVSNLLVAGGFPDFQRRL